MKLCSGDYRGRHWLTKAQIDEQCRGVDGVIARWRCRLWIRDHNVPSESNWYRHVFICRQRLTLFLRYFCAEVKSISTSSLRFLTAIATESGKYPSSSLDLRHCFRGSQWMIMPKIDFVRGVLMSFKCMSLGGEMQNSSTM